MDFFNEVRVVGKPISLGVLGKREQVTKTDIHEKILHPLVSAIGRLPDKMLIPAEGTSSAYITLWAENTNIETHCVEADWKKLQRKAAFLRDARIMKESTHLLIFLGTRSKAYEQTAILQAKKGKEVYVVDDTLSMCQYVVESE